MIYIHVPFCHRKCTYCAFFSKAESGKWKVERYVDALLDEMRQRKGEQAHPVRTVYFGGGTPSILPLEQLGRIVGSLRECFDLSQVEEVTLEANPEDLSPEYLRGLKDMGFVNRLSIGIQSLDDEMLRLIGRRHTARQAVEAVENAYNAGFHNISVDFIYGLPSSLITHPSSLITYNSSLITHHSSLITHHSSLITHHLSLITHVSAYALSVEPGTALAVQVEQGRVVLPDEDEVVRQYHALHAMLSAEGFEQYEVSNYCRPGFGSKHNSRYWDRTPYLGLGPGAHSFDGKRRRWNNPDGTFCEEILTDRDAHNEMLMTALRTTAGLPIAEVPLAKMQPYIDRGWIRLTPAAYVPTEEGLLHADGIAADLFEV